MGLNFRKCRERNSCMAACIASLIDRDDVPHFFDGRDGVQAWDDLRKWLKQHGHYLLLFPYESDPRPLMAEVRNDSHYILMCGNGHGDHAVICKGSERVFDPGWIQSPIEGPMQNGFWLVGVVI